MENHDLLWFMGGNMVLEVLRRGPSSFAARFDMGNPRCAADMDLAH
jgi:hypothetical protein